MIRFAKILKFFKQNNPAENLRKLLGYFLDRIDQQKNKFLKQAIQARNLEISRVIN